ncbi:20130_t:CDS:2 [Dentiscutata erythropus]|uniref:20130_t:CDS:1 n=1 Tax=Dentiscutata erythropus TaxID=1348616 RepID=A0A9N8YUR4_9GLOM|nr:20130_t:CDS:2 [Dentiscutata erythropus]
MEQLNRIRDEIEADINEDEVEEDKVERAEANKVNEVKEVEEAELEVEEEIEQLIFEIPSHHIRVMATSNYIWVDNNLETEEVTIDEAAIIKEICHQSDFSNSDNNSNVKILIPLL